MPHHHNNHHHHENNKKQKTKITAVVITAVAAGRRTYHGRSRLFGNLLTKYFSSPRPYTACTRPACGCCCTRTNGRVSLGKGRGGCSTETGAARTSCTAPNTRWRWPSREQNQIGPVEGSSEAESKPVGAGGGAAVGRSLLIDVHMLCCCVLLRIHSRRVSCGFLRCLLPLRHTAGNT